MTIDQILNALLLAAILTLLALYVSGKLLLRAKEKAAALKKRSCHYCKSFDARRKLPAAALQPGLVLAEHKVQALEQKMVEGPCGMEAEGSPQPIGAPRTIELVSDFWSARRKKMKILGAVQEIGYCGVHCKRVSRNSSCEQYTPHSNEE